MAMRNWQFEVFNPVIKVVSGWCNLRCDYCFYAGSQPIVETMSRQTLEAVMERCLEVAPFVRFIWHGGEPTLTGVSFYEDVVSIGEALYSPGQRIRHSIQTNGTLITDEWARFFKENGFGVGVSIDGPEKLHNLVRVDTAGGGSFVRVIRGINILRSNGAKVSAIAVVNNLTVNYPDEIFWFMYNMRLNFSINNCTAKPDDPFEVRNLAISPMKYAQFLLAMLDLWLKLDDPSFMIRPLEDIVKAVLGKQPRLCKYLGNCTRFLTIGHNGKVYPCDNFLTDEYCLGDLHKMSITDVLQGSQSKAYYSGRQKMQAKCKQCGWYLICKGGCMREWEGETYISNPVNHEFCQARRYLFENASKILSSLGYSTTVNVS
ncbi:MAG: Iron-sulfur oxidoreductase MdsB [Candidatus Woesebacteria bacterium GW2011_GWB1_43_14]|uniref:Iron-sulfur oxidoreductase MdsB n=1 Tax=Candidatus Woesebacteria bacterium GW2011_GWB1_43_14 TaxID=1618578 RepID=A0A0G1GDS8_9BACT|nr:MAG: Iron-sulfur oxidoreductase MdsB [Candidatus Woesebacteria bacterium GW2011_GWC1_42_9]KKS97033.1 MAG: Iron-sulfur oxidoreductase MdsB [Candidatus Woesebacteria bacterium GW2011_GWB1_43_14]